LGVFVANNGGVRAIRALAARRQRRAAIRALWRVLVSSPATGDERDRGD